MKRGYRINNAYAYYGYRTNTANFAPAPGFLQGVGTAINSGAQKIGQTVLSPFANAARQQGQQLRGQIQGIKTAPESFQKGWNKGKLTDGAMGQVDALTQQAKMAQQRRAGLGRMNKGVGYGVLGAGAVGTGVGANALMNNGKQQGMY